MKTYNGFLNIYKKRGMTSHDVVGIVRKKLNVKTGHLGTLDPMAEGVLPVALGGATRLIQFFPLQSKTYLAEITLGIHTDTLDMDGKVIIKDEPRFVDKELLVQTLKLFIGRIIQTPPKHSAVKVGGKRAYDMARKNIDFDMPSREVEVYSIELADYNFPKFKIRIKASPGTYVRSLCEDIGKKLNQPAVLSYLLREENGIFNIKDSVDIDAFKSLTEDKIKKLIFSIKKVFHFMPRFTIKPELKYKILNGAILDIEKFKKNSLKLKKNEKILVYDEKGELIAVGEIIIDKVIKIKPLKIFN